MQGHAACMTIGDADCVRGGRAAERMSMTDDAKEPRACDTYEDVTRHILRQVGDLLGLDLSHVSEGQQKILGDSGMEWTLDALRASKLRTALSW